MSVADWGESIDLGVAIARFPLREWLGVTKVPSEEVTLTCPRCGKDKLAVNTRTRKWRCFVCERYEMVHGKPKALAGAGGVFALVEWLTGASRRETARIIIDAVALKIPADNDLPIIDDSPPDPRQVDDGTRVPSDLPDKCIDLPGILPYMQRRGITWDDAQTYGLKWVPPWERSWVSDRLIFPVWWGPQCLYWQARACWDKAENEARNPGQPYRKTLNPSQDFCQRCRKKFDEGMIRCACGRPRQYGTADVLLNAYQASIFGRVVLCEGPTSAIRVGADAVASFGKLLHSRQIEVLRQLRVREVVVCYDGPEPGHPEGAYVEAIQSGLKLAPFFDVKIVFLPHGDPGDWPREAMRWFIDNARPLDVDRL